MKHIILIFTLLVCFKYKVESVNFPKPRVYVVTPATHHFQIDEAKTAPFYYHKWMRRMDTGTNATTAETITTTTTVPPKVLTPDLIFAEFESDGKMHKSIRKLLEKEKIVPKSTSMSPIYVPEEQDEVSRVVNYGLPVKVDNEKNERQENTSRNTKPTFDRDFYNKPQVPIYIPPRTLPSTTTISSTTSTTTTTESPVSVENIWHIIDSEKTKQQSNDWKELSFDANYKDEENVPINDNDKYKNDEDDRDDDKDQEDEDIDDNFALPG